jgi:hypothetical protein
VRPSIPLALQTAGRSDAKYADQPYFGEEAVVDRALGPLLDRLRTLSGRRSSSSRPIRRASAGTAADARHVACRPRCVRLIVALVQPGQPDIAAA